MKKKFIYGITILLCFSFGFNIVTANETIKESTNFKNGDYSLVEDENYKPFSIYINGTKLDNPKYRVATSKVGNRILFEISEIVNLFGADSKINVIKLGNGMSADEIEASISNLGELMSQTTTDYSNFKENDDILFYVNLDDDILYGVTNKIGSKDFIPFAFIKHNVYNPTDETSSIKSEGVLFENSIIGDIESYIIKTKEGDKEVGKLYYPIRFIATLFGANIRIEKVTANETRIYFDFNNNPEYSLTYNYSNSNDKSNKQISPNQCVDLRVAGKSGSVDNYLYSVNNSDLKLIEKANLQNIANSFIDNANSTVICNKSNRLVDINELDFNVFIGSTSIKEFVPTKLTVKGGKLELPKLEVYHTSAGIDYKDTIVNSNCPLWIRKTNLGNVNNIEYVDLTNGPSILWKNLDIKKQKEALSSKIKKIQYRYVEDDRKYMSDVYNINVTPKEVTGEGLSLNMCSKNADYGINPSYIESTNNVYINGSNSSNLSYNNENILLNIDSYIEKGTYTFKNNDNSIDVIINDEELGKKVKNILLTGPNGEWIGLKNPQKMDGEITAFNKEQKEYKSDGNVPKDWINVIANIEYSSGDTETKELSLENEKEETNIGIGDYKYIITRDKKKFNTNVSELQYKKDSDYKTVTNSNDEFIINENYSDGYTAKIILEDKGASVTTEGATKEDSDKNIYNLKISSFNQEFVVKAEDGTLKTYRIKLNPPAVAETLKEVVVKQGDVSLTPQKVDEYTYNVAEQVDSNKVIYIKVVGTNGTVNEATDFLPHDGNGNTGTMYLGSTAYKIKFTIKSVVPLKSYTEPSTPKDDSSKAICKNEKNENQYLNGTGIRVRTSPNTTSSIITSLSNTTVTVVAEAKGESINGNNVWKMIKIPNSNKCGWVYSKYVTTASPTKSPGSDDGKNQSFIPGYTVTEVIAIINFTDGKTEPYEIKPKITKYVLLNPFIVRNVTFYVKYNKGAGGTGSENIKTNKETITDCSIPRVSCKTGHYTKLLINTYYIELNGNRYTLKY